MRVAAFLPTHHLPEESLPWMAEAKTVFDDFVIFIDEHRATAGTIDRAQSLGSRVHCHQSDTWFKADCVGMARACKSEWVFLIEYDEQLSSEWQQRVWRRILETTKFTHFWFPRRWVAPGGRYITSNPWWPDFQLRLFRNNLEGTTFAKNVHDTIYIPGPGAYFRNLAIHHHVLSLLSRPQRVAKVQHYEELRPGGGLGHYYLYEDYAPPQAPLPKPVTLDINREIIRMEKLAPEKISKISINVSAVPREMHASAMFWVETELTNGTTESIYSCPPFPVHLAYHWIEKATRRTVVFDGNRSAVFPGLDANATRQCPMTIIVPDRTGEYILQTTMVQENVCWFENVRPDILQEFAVSVIAD
jgi:hypothetical protein